MGYKDPKKQKAAQRAHYERKKEKIKERSRNKRIANKKWLSQQKDKPCFDCNENFPSYVMDFHHLNPNDKTMSVANAITRMGREKILAEINKCILLCANCHRIREYQEK